MKSCPLWNIRLVTMASVLLMLVLTNFRVPGTSSVLADNIPQGISDVWKATGVAILETEITGYCFDPRHPSVVLISDRKHGTVAYDWHAGIRTEINPRQFWTCGPSGFLYGPDKVGGSQTDLAWRFSLDDPVGQLIKHWPTSVALDGTLRIYSYNHQDTLLTSTDAGLTWTNIGRELGGRILGYYASDVDSRFLYAIAYENSIPQGKSGKPVGSMDQIARINYNRVYFSSNAGQTWEERGIVETTSSEAGYSTVRDIVMLPGTNSATNIVIVYIFTGHPNTNAGVRAYLMFSNDSGETFDTTEYGPGYTGPYYYHTNDGILRLNGVNRTYGDLALSTDEGISWSSLSLPNGMPIDAFYFSVMPQFPFMILVERFDPKGGFHQYYSMDGAHTWQPLGLNDRLGSYPSTTPFMPLRSFIVQEHGLYMRDWTDAGARLSSTDAQNNVPDGTYFHQTGHNLFGNFRQYWYVHGGIAQFGYPTTDPFLEVSQTDGKAYMAQYFERAELELHPENASPYDVLPSLLGVQAYNERYGEGVASGQHPATGNPLYFPETGFTIGGKFRAYWESHGGLPQQGYPLSNEFTEVSPTDGQPYTVQYFQRSEFELHPENAGTANEVLLAQLGVQQFNARYDTDVVQP